jgi:ribosomal protein S18 acetylase RimI-like enzyme
LADEGREAQVSVRGYEPRDRQAVREISYETADGGEPGTSIHRDRELIADLLTRYYTDFEPESLLVADAEGKAVGYAAGCLDTRKQLDVTLKRIFPRAILAAVLRGAPFRLDSWRLVERALNVYRLAGAERGVDLAQYPAHLHVDILKGYRGRRVGGELVERFLAYASSVGAAGIHLSVREDNAPARRFFEKYGFIALAKQPTLLVPRARGTLYSVVYGRKL